MHSRKELVRFKIGVAKQSDGNTIGEVGKRES